MRLNVAISLITLLLFSLFGSTLIYHWEKGKIRQTIKTKLKEGVPSNELHAFSYSKVDWKEIEKKEGGKEIIINDEYYDVVRKTITPDSIHIQAIHDKEEKILFAKLEQEIAAQWQTIPRKNSPTKLISEFFKISCLPIKQGISLYLFSSSINHYTPCIEQYSFTLYTLIDKPPSMGLTALG